MILKQYKWSFLILILLLAACASPNNQNSGQNENTGLTKEDDTTQILVDTARIVRDTLPKTDTTAKLKDSIKVAVKLPPGFEEIKKKCKYLNLKVFDLREEKDLYFSRYKALTKEEFYRLGLDKMRVKDTIYAREYDPYNYFYSFQENINGRVGIVIASVLEGVFGSLELFIYDKNGHYVDSEGVAGSGGDAGYIGWDVSKFVTERDLQKELKNYYLKEKNVCVWYKEQLKFPKKGLIIRSGPQFIVKPDSIPCHRKYDKE